MLTFLNNAAMWGRLGAQACGEKNVHTVTLAPSTPEEILSGSQGLFQSYERISMNRDYVARWIEQSHLKR